MKHIKPIKGFNALAFKAKAQKRLLKETKGMTDEELIAFYHQKAATGPFSFLYKGPKSKRPLPVREKRAAYKAR
jgi:hypothetical protein